MREKKLWKKVWSAHGLMTMLSARNFLTYGLLMIDVIINFRFDFNHLSL